MEKLLSLRYTDPKLQIRRERKRVADRNRRFAKMTRSKQRVMIAKDVIKQLDAGRLVARTGIYCFIDGIIDLNDDSSRPLHEVIANKTCTVCGIGAAFVAALDRANSLTADDIDHGSYNIYDADIRTYLEQFFAAEQIRLIEAAFEMEVSFAGGQKAVRAAEYGNQFDIDDDRLRAIMQNIIDNDGTFKP